MAKEVETETVEREKETTYYYCDKCHGRNHEKTSWKEDLNVVAFGAEAFIDPIPNGTKDAHSPGIPNNRLKVESEYDYLLCDECMERAYDYLRDFF